MTEISMVRYTTELCGYHEVADVDVKELQKEFADTLVPHFKGRVPFGNKTPFVGVNVQDSADPERGTAIVASVLTYFGVHGEDLERVAATYANKKFPLTTWEIVNEESEKRRAIEKAERKEYSKKLMGSVSERVEKARDTAKSNVAATSRAGTPASVDSYLPAEGEDANDLF